MAKAVIIRGLPGSGKSTLAKTKYPHAVHCEADKYFMRTGEYKWDPSELTAAHRSCFIEFRDALASGKDAVVSNVFANKSEMEWYVEYAINNGHELTIHEAAGNFQNVHGVTDEKMEKLRRRFQKLDPGYLGFLS